MARRAGPRSRVRRAAGAVLAALVCLGAVPAALGQEPVPLVSRRGDCTGPSDWKLTVRSIDAEILRVRLVIRGGPAGDEWNVFMDHNGKGFFAGSRTSGERGLVILRRRTEDLPGPDRIRAGAHDTATGETCAGGVMLP